MRGLRISDSPSSSSRQSGLDGDHEGQDVLDSFCHDSQRARWSYAAFEKANTKLVKLAVKNLAEHFKDTMDLVVSRHMHDEDSRVISILEDLCTRHGLIS